MSEKRSIAKLGYGEFTENEKKYYRTCVHAAEKVVGGYENAIEDGLMSEDTTLTVDDIAHEVDGEVLILIHTGWLGKEVKFIGTQAMVELTLRACNRAIRQSRFNVEA